jgi:hypothetical protein
MYRKDIKPGLIVWWKDPDEDKCSKYLRVVRVKAGIVELSALNSFTIIVRALPKELQRLPDNWSDTDESQLSVSHTVEISVKYDLSDVPPDLLEYTMERIEALLKDIGHRATEDGMLTDDTLATLVEWNQTVRGTRPDEGL